VGNCSAGWQPRHDRRHCRASVRQEVHDAYNDRLQVRLDEMIWGHPSIRHSWYRAPNGRIYILSPWRLVDYWDWTRSPDLTEFDLRVGAQA